MIDLTNNNGWLVSNKEISQMTTTYKGHLIKHEYGGYGVNGTLFDTIMAAMNYIDTLA